jgi:hypothetical protein
MKTRSYILSIIVLLSISLAGFAGEVSMKSAQTVAINHYFEMFNKFEGRLDYQQIGITKTDILKFPGDVDLYLFEISQGGFVIVAAEDKVWPVIGYAYEGTYKNDLSSETNFTLLMKEYACEVSWVRNSNKDCKPEVTAEWYRLLKSTPDDLLNTKDTKGIEPMIHSLWHQGVPYSLLCPEDPDGGGGHVVVGCGATSMSQVMHYWRYPETGTGSHQYYANPYGVQLANFGETTYLWDEMQNEADFKNPIPTAILNFQAGVALEMEYGPEGSNAMPYDVAPALQNYFKYDDAMYIQKQNYSSNAWVNMLIEQIDLGQPVLYIGYSDDGGHGFVCDGYQDETCFHFNFGWGGSANGYYNLNDIYGFHINQKCIKDICPTESEYPYYADGAKTITGTSGSLTDGSGPVEDYLNNTAASWLISPQTETDSIKSLTVKFSQFEIEDNDVLTIYDGADENAPLIGEYSGTEMPEIFTSACNQVYITFESNGSGTASGWYMEYNSNYPQYCSGIAEYTEPTATFNDESGDFNYAPATSCMYKIEPEWGSEISLFFNEFETEENEDIVKVYDGNQLLGEFSGSDLPDPMTATSGSVLIMFTSNSYNNHAGWEIYYEVDNVGVNQASTSSNLQVFPNPASEQVKVSFANYSEKEFSIELISVLGEVVYSENILNDEKIVSKTINTSELQKGTYILRLKSEKRVIAKRLVIQ